jgi:hypothetical protein
MSDIIIPSGDDMDRIASLLEQYPGPVKLGMSWGRAIYLLGTAIFMIGGAAYYAIQPDKHGAVGWLSVVVCTLGVTGLLAARLRGKFELVLDNDGLSIGEGRILQHFRWTEVENFAVVGDELTPLRKRVGFNRANTVIDETDGHEWRAFHLPESYGLTNAGCVRLLSLWQERALLQADLENRSIIEKSDTN